MTPDSLQTKIAALDGNAAKRMLMRLATTDNEAVASLLDDFRDRTGQASKTADASPPSGADVNRVELLPAVEKQLCESFDRSIEIWRELGLFSVEQGFVEPTFPEYKNYIGKHSARMESGRPDEFGKGYKELFFTPTTLPVVSESPEELSMAKALEATLREEFARRGSDKPANSLVIQTRNGNKMVLQGDKVNIDEIVWKWEGYLKQTMVHRPKTLEPDAHEGIPEGELAEHLTPLEKKNGGVVRLERPLIMLPKDLKRPTMSAQDWKGEHGKSVPKDVSFQDVREGVSWLINTIKTKHVIPDVWTGDEKTSQVALMLDTYFPNEGSSGAVAAAYFYVYDGRFDLVMDDADGRSSYGGVRGGVRINEEA